MKPQGAWSVSVSIRRRWLAVGLVAVLVSGVAGCSQSGEAAAAGKPQMMAAPVTVAQAVVKNVPVQVSAIGVVEAYTTVTIKPLVTGQVQKVHVTEGQEVKAGDLLFTIDPRPFEAALEGAQAQLMHDQALARNAHINAQQQESLYKKSASTQFEAEQAQRTADAADATVQADQAAIDAAKLQLAYCTIRSPINGRTGDILVDAGNVVAVHDTPMLVINQIKPIYVDFAVPEEYLGQLRQYMRQGALHVQVSPPRSQLPPQDGVLTFVDNKVDQATGMIKLKATFANQNEELWPGQYVNAVVELRTIPHAVVVPTPAIQTGQKGAYVFTVSKDHKAHEVAVTTDQTVNGFTVVTKGIQAGQTVVTDGQLRLAEGVPVTIKQPAEAPSAPEAAKSKSTPDTESPAQKGRTPQGAETQTAANAGLTQPGSDKAPAAKSGEGKAP